MPRVTKALRYRLFGAGKMPEALRVVASGPDVLIAAEGVSVKETVRELRMPQAKLSQGTRLMVGSLVVLPGRLLAAMGSRSIADTDFGQPHHPNATLAIASDGVRITLEVADVLPGGSGSVEVHYRLSLDDAVIARLPAPSCPVALSNAVPALLQPWQGTAGA